VGKSQQAVYFWISIHAPARGATILAARMHTSQSISIHAPARGATVNEYEGHRFLIISIHAPARGATCRPELQG